MCNVLCVTDRSLCGPDTPGHAAFLAQLGRVAAARPAGIILREKDLPPAAYAALAEQALALCRAHGVPLLLHSHPQAALDLGLTALHMPLPLLEQMPAAQRRAFAQLGASCHSVADAVRARDLGCTYIVAGHVFATTCKPGAAPRGLDFLQQVCAAVNLPVWAIGGMAPHNYAAVRAAGAAGACLRSPLMQAPDPAALLVQFG